MEGYYETLFFYGKSVTPIKMRHEPFWYLAGFFHPDPESPEKDRTIDEIQRQFAADASNWRAPNGGTLCNLQITCGGEEIVMPEVYQIACVYNINLASISAN